MPDLMRVTVRGVTYGSAKEAAKALGVAKSTVYSALCRGNPDSLGLRRGTRPPESRKSGRGKEITIGGITFPSISAASEALGFRKKYLAVALVKGRSVTKGRIAAAAMRWTAKQEMAAMRAATRSSTPLE